MMVVKMPPSTDADSNEVAELTLNLSSERLYAERSEIRNNPISKQSPCSDKSGERLTECELKELHEDSCEARLQRIDVRKACKVKRTPHKFVYSKMCDSDCSWCASESLTCLPCQLGWAVHHTELHG